MPAEFDDLLAANADYAAHFEGGNFDGVAHAVRVRICAVVASTLVRLVTHAVEIGVRSRLTVRAVHLE